MTPRDVVDALLVVLAEERAAIRALDAEGVRNAAARKEALARELGALASTELADVAAELPTLRAELRQNGVLLAHAKNCVQEVLDLAAPRAGAGRPGALRARL